VTVGSVKSRGQCCSNCRTQLCNSPVCCEENNSFPRRSVTRTRRTDENWRRPTWIIYDLRLCLFSHIEMENGFKCGDVAPPARRRNKSVYSQSWLLDKQTCFKAAKLFCCRRFWLGGCIPLRNRAVALKGVLLLKDAFNETSLHTAGNLASL